MINVMAPAMKGLGTTGLTQDVSHNPESSCATVWHGRMWHGRMWHGACVARAGVARLRPISRFVETLQLSGDATAPKQSLLAVTAVRTPIGGSNIMPVRGLMTGPNLRLLRA